MITNIAYGFASLIGLGIIFIGARFLWAPQPAAAGFGIPGGYVEGQGLQAWLAVKGVRDIASGIFIFVFTANGGPHLLGEFLLAASLIAMGDAAIVLRSGGSKVAAFGIHGATAAVIVVVGVCLVAA